MPIKNSLLVPLFLITVTLTITFFYVFSAVYYPQLYIVATYEDMYGEWGQAYFFLTTFVFSALNVISKGDYRSKWFFALLAAAAFYTFMEEVSWGQRLIGFDTPGFFNRHSYQDEANLHNLFTGPVESWTKTALTYMISLAFIGYGIIFPLTLKIRWKVATLCEHWGVAAPSLALVPAFAISAVCEMEFFAFNEAEVAELLVAMAMAFTALHHLLKNRPQWQAKNLYCFISVLLVVVVAAFMTTQSLLHNPEQKAEINNRLANGYEKFADRYERYDHYPAIAQVLQLYDQLKPDNAVILRRIAVNYRLAGDQQKANEFIDRAITAGLKQYTDDHDNVPSNISLAKSYHLANHPEKVYFYGFHAYEIALKKFEAAQDDAYWAYWLAKACEQINKQKEALKYYRKAHRLAPSNWRYERAYYEKKHLMERFYEEDE